VKKIRIPSLIIALTFVFSMLFSITTFAAVSTPYSSPTLLSYAAWFNPGKEVGELDVSYDVTANTIADSLGVSSIQICNANGLPIRLVSGTVANSMIGEDSVNHMGTYRFKGEAGSTYYAVVTVFATIDGVKDSRTITTRRATAPTTSTP